MQPGMPGMQRPMYPTGVPQPGMAPGMMAPQQVQPQIPVPKPDPPKPKYLLLIRRKRPTDKSLPKKIESYVPESKLYNEMLEFERRLDATIMRKTLDIQDALAKPSKVS
jgi:SWI/SNF-related matrix-associated actin-dependent regulator of chromatin subfamily D